MGFLSFFGRIKSYVERAVIVVKQYVPEEVQQTAISYVKDVVTLKLTNVEKRERAVKLVANHFPQVPESIVRLAVELAVTIVKKELD